jgi:hypothetical protein
MFKNIALSSLCVAVLAACGGSDTGTTQNNTESTPPITPTIPTSSEITFKVIDGYITNADVCVISTKGSSCEFLGSTNEQGLIAIPADTTGQLVATIKAGVSKDSDRIGFVPKSYQMIADIVADSPNVITPYTTIDALNLEKNMADIAADFNLPLAAINGDYIESSAVEKAQVHALARAITSLLAEDFNNNDISVLYSTAEQANEYITTDLSNAMIDLNLVNVIVSNGEFSHITKFSVLSDFLEQGPLHMTSLNNSYFYGEGGVRHVEFNNGTVSINNGSAVNYEINGDELKLTNDGQQGTDLFIYTSDSLSLSIPLADKDLIVMSTQDFGNGHETVSPLQASWVENGLVGKTKFLIFDDSEIGDFTPVPTLVKMEFDEKTVTLTENGETQTVSWSMNSGGRFKLELEQRSISYMEIITDGDITLVRGSDGAPSVLLDNEALATSIYQQWNAIN